MNVKWNKKKFGSHSLSLTMCILHCGFFDRYEQAGRQVQQGSIKKETNVIDLRRSMGLHEVGRTWWPVCVFQIYFFFISS